MRMDPTTGPTAADVLNTYEAADLSRILSRYGEERFARRIADAVVRARRTEPFTTSARLVDLVRDCVPAATRRTGGNPAKRTFQALRIEVNGELQVLEAALPAAVDALSVGGRIVVLSYHSLEDRLAKHVLAGRARSTAPPDLPVELPEHAPELRLLTRGGEKAPADEIEQTPRAASVRLRAAERIRRTRGAAA
jgi:16S rRNA (cytosine1402-N4)-methyltransferase